MFRAELRCAIYFGGKYLLSLRFFFSFCFFCSKFFLSASFFLKIFFRQKQCLRNKFLMAMKFGESYVDNVLPGGIRNFSSLETDQK